MVACLGGLVWQTDGAAFGEKVGFGGEAQTEGILKIWRHFKGVSKRLFLLTGSLATREKTALFENYARACQCFVMVRSWLAGATTFSFQYFCLFQSDKVEHFYMFWWRGCTPRARSSLIAKKMFFGGAFNRSDWGVGGAVNDVRCWLPTKVIMRCYDGEQCSTPRARWSVIAKKDDVLRWIMQWFKWGVGGWVGGGLMTCVVDC